MTVYQIKPASGGFGMFDRATDGAKIDNPDVESVQDYVAYVQSVNDCVSPIGPNHDKYPEIVDMDGRIYNQDGGTIVGWEWTDGTIQTELVYLD